MHKTTKQQPRVLALVLLAGLVLRMGLALATEGYPYDTNCFFAWALRMAEVGPAEFYAEGYFCDYPPGYLLVLWLVGLGMKVFRLNYLQTAARLLLVLVPVIADCAIALVLYRTASQRLDQRLALRFAAAAAFCPVLLFDTGVWKQIDGVFALLVLLCFVLLEQGRMLPGAVLYGLALAVKPQALLAGPVLALCFLRPLLTAKDTHARLCAVKDGALGVLCAVAPPALCGLSFWGFAGLWSGLTEKYLTTAGSYPYATINGFNLMAALGGNWTAQTERFWLFGRIPLCTWQQLGMALLLALTVFAAVLAWRAAKKGCFSPLLLAAVYTVGVFTFSHRMHERYLILGVVLLCAAAARLGSRKLFLLSAGLSLTSLFNLAVVYCTVGSDDEFLNSAASTLMMRATGLAETVLCLLLLAAAWDLCSGREPQPFELQPVEKIPAPPQTQPVWTRREKLLLTGLTLCVAAVSFAYLGDTTAPQTCVDANGQGSVQYTVRLNGDADHVLIYPGISSDNDGRLTIADANGTAVVEMELSYGNPFTWKICYGDYSAGLYTITVAEGQVFEIEFRDEDGRRINLTSQSPAETDGMNSALFDEATLVPDTVSQLNSFYFDEIYHARTGYETLHGMKVYETTHPPLGKDFIALGIAIFGMTGFGWRFFGTLFGVLMVPALYLLARRLTRKPGLAAFAAVLLSLDFMRFSQSRLATIDSYVTFFILLGAYWMVCYCQSVLQKGVGGSILPMALCGVTFGLGCASKWTGMYAGVGLAVCYFGVLWQRYKQLCTADASASRQETGRKRRQFLREFGLAIGGGVLFFVVVPMAIYLMSYLPYRLYDPDFGLREWWSCQTYMYWYHSSLEATHAFSSCWYSWPLDLRPVWYYMGSGLPEGSYASIAGFFSPVVCWLGTAAMLCLFAKGLAGRSTAAQRGVMVFFLSQLLPWVLVTRCTFLYHFFPCLPFLVLALTLCLEKLQLRNPPAARRAGVGVLAAAAVLFVWFYPALSGLPVSGAWAASLKWLPSWGFYIL